MSDSIRESSEIAAEGWEFFSTIPDRGLPSSGRSPNGTGDWFHVAPIRKAEPDWDQVFSKTASVPLGVGDMYHVSPRANRESILQNGLTGTQRDTLGTPWTDAYDKGHGQPAGNYFFDNPEDAHDYIYNLHHKDHDVDHEVAWENRFEQEDPPAESHGWNDEQWDNFYDNAEYKEKTDDPNGYDIWKVNVHGHPVYRDPETALVNPGMDLGEISDRREDPSYHGTEPMRYYSPIDLHPSKVQLHQHVPTWNLSSDDFYDRLDNSYEREVPSMWQALPFTSLPMPGHESKVANLRPLPEFGPRYKQMLDDQGISIEPWEVGHYGKGHVYQDGTIHAWKTDGADGEPSHDTMADREVRSWHVIDPNGMVREIFGPWCQSEEQHLSDAHALAKAIGGSVDERDQGDYFEDVFSKAGAPYGNLPAEIPDAVIHHNGGQQLGRTYHARPETHSEPWRPGRWGKAIFRTTPKGHEFHTWAVDHAGGWPHHASVTEHFRPMLDTVGTSPGYEVHPDGRVEPVYETNYDGLIPTPFKLFKGGLEDRFSKVATGEPNVEWHDMGEQDPGRGKGWMGDHSMLYDHHTDTLHIGTEPMQHAHLYDAIGNHPMSALYVYDNQFGSHNAPPEQHQRLYSLVNKWHQDKFGWSLDDAGSEGWGDAFSKRADYYHRAPTTERARIHQHGLIPGKPLRSERWTPKEIPTRSLKAQPEGVYVTDNERGFPMEGDYDTWRIPSEAVKEVEEDKRADHSWIIPHHVDPVLHERYEDSDAAEGDATRAWFDLEQLPGETEAELEPWQMYFEWAQNADKRGVPSQMDEYMRQKGVGFPTHIVGGLDAQAGLRTPYGTEVEPIDVNTPTYMNHEQGAPVIYDHSLGKMWRGPMGGSHSALVRFVPELTHDPYGGSFSRPEGVHHGDWHPDKGVHWYGEAEDWEGKFGGLNSQLESWEEFSYAVAN